MTDQKNDSSFSSPNAGLSGQLHNIKEDICEDAVLDDVVDDIGDELTNFACVTNHYLHLVKTSSPASTISC